MNSPIGRIEARPHASGRFPGISTFVINMTRTGSIRSSGDETIMNDMPGRLP